MIPNDWVEPYKTEDGLSYVIPNYKVARLIGFVSNYESAIQLLRELNDDLKVLEHTHIGEGSTFHERIKKVLTGDL